MNREQAQVPQKVRDVRTRLIMNGTFTAYDAEKYIEDGKMAAVASATEKRLKPQQRRHSDSDTRNLAVSTYRTPQELETSRPCPVDRAVWADTVTEQLRFVSKEFEPDGRFIPVTDACSEINLSPKQFGRMMDDPSQWPPVPTTTRVTRNRRVFFLRDWIYFKASLLAKQHLNLWETPTIPPTKIASNETDTQDNVGPV